MKKLISLLIVLGLAAQASALIVEAGTTVTWSERARVGQVEVYGHLEVTAYRMDMDDGDTIIVHAGGTVDFQGELKFPDSDGDQNVHIYVEGGGYMECADVESQADRGSHLHMGNSGTFKTGNIGDDKRDPGGDAWDVQPIPPATGYDITYDGNVATVHGTPEPATIALLGFGCLALLRKRR